MLNTSKISQNNVVQNTNDNCLRNMATENLIDKTIREIDATSRIQNNIDDRSIVESFHSMENNIFTNITNPANALNNSDRKVGSDAFKIDNFNLDEITQKYSDDEIIRSINNNEKKLLISINDKLNKISVFDEKNLAIGYFTISHIAKYLGDLYDIKKQFLNDLDIQVYQKSKELIKMLIFKLKYNKVNKYIDIVLYDYTISGFMGDIELLIKLNNILYKYQKEEMHADLSKVDLPYRIKIEQNIKKFIFMLLSYTLQLISIMSDKVKDEKLKENLINYSVGVVYRINLFVQEQLKVINNNNNNVSELLKKNLEIKHELKDKLDILIEHIRSNNKKNKK